MDALAKEAFGRLKPACIALSNTTLLPSYGTTKLPPPIEQLDAVLAATAETSPVVVSQSVGNYVFMPVKPLLVADAPEAVLARVFAILAWLIQTEWFSQEHEMTLQLLRLLSTFLARAKTEELKRAVFKSIHALFDHAGAALQVLEARPTLAHLTTTLLEDSADVVLHEAGLGALLLLYRQIDPETAASFLPGTVSSLTRTLTKSNQKSPTLVKGVQLLQASILKSLAGVYDGYRAGKWFEATASQLQLAITPILAHLLKSDREAVMLATVGLCKALLDTKLKSQRFVEFLLQVEPDALGEAQHDTIAEVVHSYVDSVVRILQSTDEDRKCNMLKTLTLAMQQLHPASKTFLSDKLLLALMDFCKFTPGSQLVKSIQADELPSAPRLTHLSEEAQACLCSLLAVLTPAVTVPLDTPEGFYLAQQLGQPTYNHALCHLADQTELAQVAILQQARRDGPLFKPHLRHSLFPLLTLPQPNRHVLDEIAVCCTYDDTAAMLVDQADYLINSLSLAFVTLDLTPSTPRTLGLLCQLAPRMVNLVEDVVAAYFDVLDAYHRYEVIVTGIFDGLQGVVLAAALQVAEPDAFAKAIEAGKADEAAEEEEQQVGTAYKLVLQICQKAQLFLSHADPQIRISLLSLLTSALPVLAANENKFLPFIHLIWPPLCHLLDDPQAYVVANAYQLVAKLITLAGAFMRRRVREDLLWRMQEILSPPKDARGNLIHSRPYTSVTLISTTRPVAQEDNPRAAIIGDARNKRGIQAPGQEIGLGPAGERQWFGTARRHVAEGIEATLAAVVRDASLQSDELAGVLSMIRGISERSALLRQVLAEQAA